MPSVTGFSPVSLNCTQPVTRWLSQQSATALTSVPALCTTGGVAGKPGQTAGSNICGMYWDAYADGQALLPFFYNFNDYCPFASTPGCESLHLLDEGVKRFEYAISASLVSRTIPPGLSDAMQLESYDQTVQATLGTTSINSANYGVGGANVYLGATFLGWESSATQDLGGPPFMEWWVPPGSSSITQVIDSIPGAEQLCWNQGADFPSGNPVAVDTCLGKLPGNTNTLVLSANTADALAGTASGSLSLKNLTLANGGTLTAPGFVPPNVAFQVNVSNHFTANGATANNFQPSNPAGVAVQEQGSSGTLIPAITSAQANGGGTLTLATVAAAGAIYVTCSSSGGSTTAPTDSTSDTFTQFGPTVTDGGFSYIMFKAENVVGGSGVNIIQAPGSGCGTGANNGWTAMAYTNVPTSGTIDGTPTLTNYPESSGGDLSVTTSAVTTTQGNDTLVIGTIVRYIHDADLLQSAGF